MGFETPQLTESIHAENLEEHEQCLFDRIAEISLLYLRKRQEQKRISEENITLKERINRFTPIQSIILRPLSTAQGIDQKKGSEFIKELNDRIGNLDSETYQDEDILEIIRDVRQHVSDYVDVAQKEKGGSGTESREESLIELGSTNVLGFSGEDPVYKELMAQGIKPHESVLDIHIKPVFKSGEGKLSTSVLKKELERVAERILVRAPDASVVIGSSWLMDTPVAERLGFTCVSELELPIKDFGAWFQFIDEHGQIHQDRLKQMLETGELPFKNTLGYIRTKDFLRRYLSKERKEQGMVTLEEVDEEEFHDVERIRAETILANEDWDKEIDEQRCVDFDRFIASHHVVSEILELYQEEDRSLVLQFMREIAEKGIKQSDIRLHTTPKIQRANKIFNQNLHRKMYRRKEVDLSK